MEKRSPYVYITDTHLMPYNRFKMLNAILEHHPKGVFLTGDISNSAYTLYGDLKFLGKRIGRPLYFTLGNHDIHGSDIETVFRNVRSVCKEYKNLILIDEAGIVPLTDELGLIGQMGFYDARIGNPDYIKYTFDWWMIKDARILPTMKDRIELFRSWAQASADSICTKLEEAVATYKTVYLLTHFPPFAEANRCSSMFSEQFWEPYNTNFVLGQQLEKVMEKYKKRNLVIFSGHVHKSSTIHISRNIECRVGKGSYLQISDEELIYI